MKRCVKCNLIILYCTCKTIYNLKINILKITEQKVRYKYVTIIKGEFPLSEINNISRELKEKYGCGGTVNKKKEIVLQGKHKNKLILYFKINNKFIYKLL